MQLPNEGNVPGAQADESPPMDVSISEEEELTPPEKLSIVDDYEIIAEKALAPLDEEIIDQQYSHWEIKEFSKLPDRSRGRVFEAGGHKWNILLFPRGNNQMEWVSVYLEYADLQDNPSPENYACAQFLICASSLSNSTHYTINVAHHRFTTDESDWGFTRYMELGMLCNTEAPFLEDDGLRLSVVVRVVKDSTGVLWHNFVNYDSKKTTGHVGMTNQGATCYMNSLFQSLYCTNYFRKAVYEIPTENDDPNNSVALALQRVFYNLQFTDTPVSTTELTRSFGWTSLDAFMQHDVQEFNRVLQDNLEAKMKGTPADGAIKKLFVGRMKSYIKCINVNYESSRSEDYYDIQLNVKGCKNLEESFKDYIAEETLEGDNKYMAEGHGLQDAKKGVIFESFPPVLHLQLKRFEYDFMRDTMVKINDHHEFPLEIDLEPFLSHTADRSQAHKYILHGVLVHSGDLSGGHYFAFVKPAKDGRWLKFDDDRVVPATMKEVLDENYGDEQMPMRPAMRYKRFTNAYMLVYIRESMINDVLPDVTKEDIPRHLIERIEEERQLREKRLKEREEQHLYMNITLISDKSFQANEGFDVVQFDEKNLANQAFVDIVRIPKNQTFGEFKNKLSESIDAPASHFRLWVMVNRQNRTVRPDTPIYDGEENSTMDDLRAKCQNTQPNFRLYMETPVYFDAKGNPTFPTPPQSNTTPHMLVFVKLFEPELQKIRGVGKIYVIRSNPVRSIEEELNEMFQYAPGTELLLYEEIQPKMIEALNKESTFLKAEIQDGDIICAQKKLTEDEELRLREAGLYITVPEYMNYLLHRVQVSFAPKIHGSNVGFQLTLHNMMKHDEVAAKVAAKLGTDPDKIRFYVPNLNDEPKAAVRPNVHTTLEDMLQTVYSRTYGFKLFYEVLNISLSELEFKRLVKITICRPTLDNTNTLELLLLKESQMSDLIDTLNEQQVVSEDLKIRVFETIKNRFYREFRATDPISELTESADAQLYMEDESFVDTKKRLQRRTGLDDKEWSKVRISIVSPLSTTPIKEDEFQLFNHKFNNGESLGLDHIDKSGRYKGGSERGLFIKG
ncbi:hypothetical protein DFQ28_003237 [Apophysomyces sp. BC1034]|nr:hypothetical protein DFQ30_004753 [Apophysomyces sp. BC1015]KAG0189592.1 hypothetical protein DFQ28_003237 [Apophysomyces sp. BC1034]